MRIDQGKKKVQIHKWEFDGDYRMDLSEFQKQAEKTLEKISGKHGFAEIDISEEDNLSSLEKIVFYEVLDKTEEDLEAERIKMEAHLKSVEDSERELYNRLKEKFEGKEK